jgi:glucose-1-phosphate thymidylyltransferase
MKKNRKKIKGVILAGGHATRLHPLTLVTNKHLLPIYDRPMIYYPLQSMKDAGIKDVLIITNPEHAGDFLNLLGTGEEFGLSLHFAIQKKPGGLAEAVSLAKSFSNHEPFVVILGDNLFDFCLKPAIARFLKQKKGARIFTKSHPAPQH